MITLLRIATRQSKLALWQAEHVADRLRAAHSNLNIELVKLTTQGDRILDRPLADIGGKGLFIKELEVALTEQRADLAVHSMKDMPSDIPPGLALTAMLTRADPRDAFISNKYNSIDALPNGARVGTSSLRRQSQLYHLRRDLSIVQLRGNVDTRLRKLDAGEYDAIILASAGLIRLGWHDRITQFIPIEQSLPAVGQGIIGIECRADDRRTRDLVGVLNDATATACIAAERAFAKRLEGSCQSPIAGFAEYANSSIKLQGLVASLDGRQVFRDTVVGAANDAENVGTALAERLLYAGAGALLTQLRAHNS